VRSVLAGDRPACKYVKQACQRFLDDMERAYRYQDIWFDPIAFGDVCWVLEKFPHVKGKWAAKRELLVLSDWQVFVLANVFGFKRVVDGELVNLRRFFEMYIEVPRKNGKTFFMAAVGNYMLTCDGEEGAEVYCGATSEKQALEVFTPAKKICTKTEDFRTYYGITVNAKTITVERTGSKFEPVIGNPGDGASPSCGIVDEFHEHDDSDLAETFVTGMGAREQPLIMYITTSGSDMGGPCYEKRADVLNVLNRTVEDDTVFGIVYTVDEEDSWDTVEAQIKANPNYGVSVSAEFLAGQLSRARRSATKQASYRTKHLNQWVGAKQAWMNMLAYQACISQDLRLEQFAGCEAFIGLDLASTTDIASMAVYLPEPNVMFWYNYVPESVLEEQERYAAWHAAGHLQATPGNIIDYNYIEDDLRELKELLQIVEVPYDPFQATKLATELLEEGFPMVSFGATVKNFSEPMKKLEALIITRNKEERLRVPDDPVVKWMFGNVVSKVDKKDNTFPDKESRKNKIDAPVAGIMAIGRAIAPREEEPIPELIVL